MPRGDRPGRPPDVWYAPDGRQRPGSGSQDSRIPFRNPRQSTAGGRDGTAPTPPSVPSSIPLRRRPTTKPARSFSYSDGQRPDRFMPNRASIHVFFGANSAAWQRAMFSPMETCQQTTDMEPTQPDFLSDAVSPPRDGGCNSVDWPIRSLLSLPPPPRAGCPDPAARHPSPFTDRPGDQALPRGPRDPTRGGSQPHHSRTARGSRPLASSND